VQQAIHGTGELALVVEQLPASIAIFDADLRYVAVSRRFLSEMECIFSRKLPSPTEVVGRSVNEILPDLPLRWYEAQVRVLAGEDLAEQEDFVQHEDGSTIFLRWSLKPWRTANGQTCGELLFTQLTTEEVVAKRALAESEARLRATFENAAVGIAHVSSDLRWRRANEALCRILRWPMDEFLTKSLRDISHPDDLAVDLAYVEQMRARKIDSYAMDKRYLSKDGQIIWGRLTVSCVRLGDGSIDYFVAIIEDITGRKLAEEELRKSEERFRTSILHSPVPTALYDDREQILAISESWLKAAGGVSADDFRRIEDMMNYHFDGGERSHEVLELAREIIATEPEGRKHELMVTIGGKKRIWNCVSSGLGTLSDGRRLYVTMAQDVTDRRTYEERIDLLMREARHRTKNILGLIQAIARQTGKGASRRTSLTVSASASRRLQPIRTYWFSMSGAESM
jgi:PAS domain S-box-containing protein